MKSLSPVLNLLIVLLAAAIIVVASVALVRLARHAAMGRSANGVYNVRNFGAMGNAVHPDAAAINRAISACSGYGGGTVLIPPGKYLCGTVLLKSNVTLHLQKGAEIFGSPHLTDYAKVDPFVDGDGQSFGYCLIGAAGARNIGITGHGTVNGDGVGFNGDRPFLVRLADCRGVTVRNVRLTQSAAWGLNLYHCRTVLVSHVTIYNHANYNNDGIDIDSSELVRIVHCNINSEDDCICFKTTTRAPCCHIRVRDCRLSSLCAAVKFGSESRGTFSDIHVRDCHAYDTRLGGIKILCMDGGHIHNVRFDNFSMRNVDMPIFIRLGARLGTFHPGQKPEKPGSISNIVIRNVTATACNQGHLLFPTGIFITGIPQDKIGSVVLDNVQMTLTGGAAASDAHVHVPEVISEFPDFYLFSKYLPAYGMFARHVRNLRLNHVDFHLELPDGRPAIVCQDVSHVVWNQAPAPVFQTIPPAAHQ